jgi:hypothetical protein
VIHDIGTHLVYGPATTEHFPSTALQIRDNHNPPPTLRIRDNTQPDAFLQIRDIHRLMPACPQNHALLSQRAATVGRPSATQQVFDVFQEFYNRPGAVSRNDFVGGAFGGENAAQARLW